MHSLISALSRQTGIKLVLISPEELKLPGYVMHEVVKKYNMPCVVTTDLEAALPELDILYMTRVQRERFSDLEVYERLKDSYILTAEKLNLAKPDTMVLHPLPRVNEISVKIDDDPRACYFKQVQNGKYMRMALILTLLRDAEGKARRPEPKLTDRAGGEKLFVNKLRCRNPSCITVAEQELDQLCRLMDKDKGIYRCAYCDKKIVAED